MRHQIPGSLHSEGPIPNLPCAEPAGSRRSGEEGHGDAAGTLRIESSSRDPLHELARKGARDMIAQALDEEVREYLERCTKLLPPYLRRAKSVDELIP